MKNEEELQNRLEELRLQFKKGLLPINLDGINLIKKNFTKKIVLSSLIKEFKRKSDFKRNDFL